MHMIQVLVSVQSKKQVTKLSYFQIFNKLIKSIVFTDDESGEKSISVLLDNEESDLIFTDYSAIDFNADLDLLVIFIIVFFLIAFDNWL